MTCAVRMRKRGRGKSNASHQVSGLSHLGPELATLCTPGLLTLDPPLACPPFGRSPRRFGVDTEVLRFLAAFLKLEKLFDVERKGTLITGAGDRR